jgi:3-hydroxyacyl-CoA dehydrogenase
VEVIRGPDTSELAAATVATYATAMGKTPIVVKECPGFPVNRILTPYLIGFLCALHDGADYVAIDRVMESFGWPIEILTSAAGARTDGRGPGGREALRSPVPHDRSLGPI